MRFMWPSLFVPPFNPSTAILSLRNSPRFSHSPPHGSSFQLTRHANGLHLPPQQLSQPRERGGDKRVVPRGADVVHHERVAETLRRSHLDLGAVQEGALASDRRVKVTRHRVKHDADDGDSVHFGPGEQGKQQQKPFGVGVVQDV